MITQDKLKEVLDYDPETGFFTWKVSNCSRVSVGDIAGCLMNTGYIMIQIDEKRELAHRLAFTYMTGSCPEIVDHINRIRHDNRWCNLREASTSENRANISKHSNNKCGYKNIYWVQSRKAWRVQVRKEGIKYEGGYYKELKDAVDQANELRFELYGEFALYEKFID